MCWAGGATDRSVMRSPGLGWRSTHRAQERGLERGEGREGHRHSCAPPPPQKAAGCGRSWSPTQTFNGEAQRRSRPVARYIPRRGAGRDGQKTTAAQRSPGSQTDGRTRPHPPRCPGQSCGVGEFSAAWLQPGPGRAARSCGGCSRHPGPGVPPSCGPGCSGRCRSPRRLHPRSP